MAKAPIEIYDISNDILKKLKEIRPELNTDEPKERITRILLNDNYQNNDCDKIRKILNDLIQPLNLNIDEQTQVPLAKIQTLCN